MRAITAGKDSQAEVRVAVEDDGRVAPRSAVRTDMIVASAKAYVHALNNAAAAKGD